MCQDVYPLKTPSENCDLHSWEMPSKAEERGKGATTEWFAFILWFISQKLLLPLFFFFLLKRGKLKEIAEGS